MEWQMGERKWGTRMRWWLQDEANQEENERDEYVLEYSITTYCGVIDCLYCKFTDIFVIRAQKRLRNKRRVRAYHLTIWLYSASVQYVKRLQWRNEQPLRCLQTFDGLEVFTANFSVSGFVKLLISLLILRQAVANHVARYFMKFGHWLTTVSDEWMNEACNKSSCSPVHFAYLVIRAV